jgi:hypothetical protein
MVTSYEATPEIEVLASAFPIPGFGFIPVNAFVLKGPEPILVDTGIVVESAEFMAALRSTIDPAELRWIWLTHTDSDHIGCLHRLLDENPRLRVITTFLGAGIMSLSAPLPMDRVNFVNPGESITVGDRTLTPPNRRPSTTPRPPASTTAGRAPSSVRTVLEPCFSRCRRVRPNSQSRTCGKVRSSGRPSTRRGCTRWIATRSPGHCRVSGRPRQRSS